MPFEFPLSTHHVTVTDGLGVVDFDAGPSQVTLKLAGDPIARDGHGGDSRMSDEIASAPMDLEAVTAADPELRKATANLLRFLATSR
jgi:hypothetical protein